MIEKTGSRRDAASTLFNLPDFRGIDAADEDAGARRVLVESMAPPGCPGCGVIATRVHARRQQVVREAGPLQVVWAKRRWVCAEDLCARRTFWERAVQVPTRARSTVRLKDALVTAVIGSGRSARETATAHSVSWWLVQAALSAVAVLPPAVDDVPVRRLNLFWQLDRGGPDGRALPDVELFSFWFTQDAIREYSDQFDRWQPRFLDYLYLSMTNLVAFSPTDTMPLTRTAKMLMAWQSTAALATFAVVVARAVNVLT